MEAFPYSQACEARIEALEQYFGLTPPPQTWEQRFETLEVAAGTNIAPASGVTRSWLERLAALDAVAGFPS